SGRRQYRGSRSPSNLWALARLQFAAGHGDRLTGDWCHGAGGVSAGCASYRTTRNASPEGASDSITGATDRSQPVRNQVRPIPSSAPNAAGVGSEGTRALTSAVDP